MKTILKIVLFSVVITGCEKPKDYKCVCTITEESLFGGPAKTNKEIYIIHNKKRKAVKQCDSHEPDGMQIWTKTECAVQ